MEQTIAEKLRGILKNNIYLTSLVENSLLTETADLIEQQEKEIEELKSLLEIERIVVSLIVVVNK